MDLAGEVIHYSYSTNVSDGGKGSIYLEGDSSGEIAMFHDERPVDLDALVDFLLTPIFDAV